jgi:hypothetical protein
MKENERGGGHLLQNKAWKPLPRPLAIGRPRLVEPRAGAFRRLRRAIYVEHVPSHNHQTP